MKKKFINGLTDFITKYKECSDRDIKVIKYGLEGLYSLVTKMIVIIFCVLLLDSFYEFLLFFIFYALLRQYSFGLHAKSSLTCWLTTLPIYIGSSLLIKFYSFNLYLIFIICIFSFISFLLWSPADTPNRPLIHKKTRLIQKIKTCTISLIYLIIILFSKYEILNDAIAVSLFVQMTAVNPLAYKITKTPFNNYKNYVNKV